MRYYKLQYKNCRDFLLPKVLIYILFLLSFFNRAENLYAQTCYRWFDEQAGYAGNNIPVTLETAACSAKVAMTNDYDDQFGVFSTAFYTHSPATFGTADPIFQATLVKIEAINPYYLVFSRITDNKIFTGINASVRLPEGGIFHCLTEGDRLDIQRFVSERTQAVFQEHGMTPDAAIKAEEAGINKLKEILEKIAICCNSPEGCTFCPDLDKAIELRAYFENPDNCFIGIPIKIYTEPPISKPGLKNNQKNNLTGSVENHTSIEVEFREGDDHGALSNVLNDVLNSDYFEDLSARGFITDNHYFCEEGNLEAIEEAYSDEGFEVSVWAHIWHNPDDSTAQAYLYVASRNSAGDLCRIDRPDVLGELEHSFASTDYVYESRFKQSASVVFANIAADCQSQSLPTSNYTMEPALEILCHGAQAEAVYFMSPAGQPVKLSRGAIPHVSSEVAYSWGYDSYAIHGFTTGSGYWKGCGTRYAGDGNGVDFLGFFNFNYDTKKYQAVLQSEMLAPYKVWIATIAGQNIKLSARNYQPPVSRPVNLYATGPFVDDIDNLELPSTPEEQLYSFALDLPVLEKLKSALHKALLAPNKKYKGTLIKVPKDTEPTDNYEYYLCIYNPGTNDNEYYRYSCGTGKWQKIDDPFVQNNGEFRIRSRWGSFILFKSKGLEKWMNTTEATYHDALDMLGMLPIVGEVFDLGNGVLYYMEGDNFNAVLCATSAIPLVGEFTPVVKRGLKIGSGVNPDIQAGLSAIGADKTPRYIEFVKICGSRPAKGDSGSEKMSSFPCIETHYLIDLDPIYQKAQKFLNANEYTTFINEAMESFGEMAYEVSKNPDLLEAWAVLKHDGVLRKNLDEIKNWATRLAEWRIYGGLTIDFDATKQYFIIKKGAGEVARIKDGDVLITSYNPAFYDPAFSGEPIGEIVNGCQAFKQGNEIKFKRVPDSSPFGLKPNIMQGFGSEQHCLERHGHDVSDKALRLRATESYAPDGKIVPGTYSSKFHSLEMELDAISKLQSHPDYIAKVDAGVDGFSITYPPGGVTSTTSFGYGYQQSLGADPNSLVPVEMSGIFAAFKKDVTTGQYYITTMYPKLP